MEKPEPWMVVAANEINCAFAAGKIKTVNDTAAIIAAYIARREEIAKVASSLWFIDKDDNAG